MPRKRRETSCGAATRLPGVETERQRGRSYGMMSNQREKAAYSSIFLTLKLIKKKNHCLHLHFQTSHRSFSVSTDLHVLTHLHRASNWLLLAECLLFLLLQHNVSDQAVRLYLLQAVSLLDLFCVSVHHDRKLLLPSTDIYNDTMCICILIHRHISWRLSGLITIVSKWYVNARWQGQRYGRMFAMFPCVTERPQRSWLCVFSVVMRLIVLIHTRLMGVM